MERIGQSHLQNWKKKKNTKRWEIRNKATKTKRWPNNIGPRSIGLPFSPCPRGTMEIVPFVAKVVRSEGSVVRPSGFGFPLLLGGVTWPLSACFLSPESDHPGTVRQEEHEREELMQVQQPWRGRPWLWWCCPHHLPSQLPRTFHTWDDLTEYPTSFETNHQFSTLSPALNSHPPLPPWYPALNSSAQVKRYTLEG